MLDLKNSLQSKPSNIYSVQQASSLARRAMLQRLNPSASHSKKPDEKEK